VSPTSLNIVENWKGVVKSIINFLPLLLAWCNGCNIKRRKKVIEMDKTKWNE